MKHTCQRLGTICLAASIILLAVRPAVSTADNPALGSITEETTGNDVFWTSPTAVDLGFPRYATTFDITRVEVFTFLGGTDVTDQLTDANGTGISASLPVTFLDSAFTEPTTGTSATVNVGIDASGFGHVAITDVVLGRFLFFQITRIEVDANLSVRGLVPGDFDGNFIVDELDLAQWETAFGVGAEADTNFDGQSDGLDFLDWQQYLGSDYSTLGATITSVPEPPAWILSLVAGLVGVSRVKSA